MEEQNLEIVGRKIKKKRDPEWIEIRNGECSKSYDLITGSWISLAQKDEIIQSSVEIAQHCSINQSSASSQTIHHDSQTISAEQEELCMTEEDLCMTQEDTQDQKEILTVKVDDTLKVVDTTQNQEDAQEEIEEIEKVEEIEEIEELEEIEKVEEQIMDLSLEEPKEVEKVKMTVTTKNIVSPYKRDISESSTFSPLLSGAVRSVNPIIEQVLKSIKLLEENDESLKILDLKDVSVFSNLHGQMLAKALENNTNLEALDLSNTKLQTVTAIEIARALEVNKGLRILNMSNNHIKPEGMRELAQMLKVNTSLIELVLSNQKYSTGSNAEEAFADALKKNNTLLKLTLKINGVAARTAIDHGISKNNTLARSMEKS